MRQSLAQLEEAFVEHAHLERSRRELQRREVARRSRRRQLDRVHKQGSMRFAVLVLVLLGTAAIVTVAMFETLYALLG
jgi:hypothetical protein